MRNVLTVKQGDRYPTYWRVPEMDLTGSTVRLLARLGSDTAIVLPSTISDPTRGEVTHMLDGTLSVGTYAVELEISTGNGEIVTAPTSSYLNLRVIADLD